MSTPGVVCMKPSKIRRKQRGSFFCKGSKPKKHLVIIQDRPTQFDVPLYAMLSADSVFDLTISYTVIQPEQDCGFDAEIAAAPQWDHLKGLVYPARSFHSTLNAWRELICDRPDHVIVCGWYPRSHALLALLLRLSGIRVGVRSDNTIKHTENTGSKGMIKRWAMSLWLGVYDAWHPVGSLAKEYLEKRSYFKRPVFYFPYAVDVAWFMTLTRQNKINRLALRQRLGFAQGDYIVIGVMKWSEREDPLTLVDAVLKARECSPNMKLLLIGDGPLHDQVISRSCMLPDIIVTPGYAKYSELPMYYAVSDIFVHPAKSEPYGVSVQEAMACGLPVITSNSVGAAVDFIEPGVNGAIFPVGDIANLSKLLSDFYARTDASMMAEVSHRKAMEWSYVHSLSEFQRCMSQNNA